MKGITPPRRGARGYFAAVLFSQLCALLRYTILARILGPEQLGLAATLIVTSAFFESLLDDGSDRFLIQDAEGDEAPVQGLVQGVWVTRGVFTAVALVVFAAPVAAFYKAPQLAEGIRILALWPLILGCLHMDMRRTQRRSDFRAEGLGLITGEASSLVVTVLVAYFSHSFIAPAFGLIARSLGMVLVSHLRAERPYRLGYARAAAARLARFVAPLIVNGWLLFMGSQTDRVLVAHQLGLAELGRYSTVLLLILYPAASLTRYAAAVHLPRIAATRDDPARGERASNILGGQTLLLALAMSTGFAIVAPTAIVILFGARFVQSAFIVGLIGILQTTRFMRVWPTTMALGVGRSGIVLANNLARLLSLPAAIAGLALIGGLAGVALGFILGEMVALSVAIVLVNRARGKGLLHDFDRVVLFMLASAAICGWTLSLTRPSGIGLVAMACASALLVAWIVRLESTTIGEAFETARALLRRGRSAELA